VVKDGNSLVVKIVEVSLETKEGDEVNSTDMQAMKSTNEIITPTYKIHFKMSSHFHFAGGFTDGLPFF
jgi:hypothetical protein